MKAIISTESWDSLQAQSLAIARQVDAGKTLPEADYHLSFADSAQLFRELTLPRLALLEQLKTLGAASIETLAEHLRCYCSAVRADVEQLLIWDLIEQDTTGRLHIPSEEIQIHVTLGHAKAA